MCIHDKREETKIFEDHAVAPYKDSPLIGHVPFQLNYFLKLSRNISVTQIFNFQKLEILLSEILFQKKPPHTSLVLLL